MSKTLTPGPFYEDENGKRRDDGLHDAMLEGNPKADAAFTRDAVREAIKAGVQPDTIKKAYG